MIYMLTQQFKIELCRPVPTYRDKSRLALWLIPFYVPTCRDKYQRAPTLFYVAPSRQVGINLGLHLINYLGQHVYHCHN